MRAEVIAAARELVNAAGFGSTERVFRKYWPELSGTEARELLAYQLTRHDAHSDEHRVIAVRLTALDRAIAAGLDAAFAGYTQATAAVVTVLNAPDWDQVRAAVESHRADLLPQVSDVAFADLVMQPAEPQVRSHMLGGWALIKQCRTLGVEAAFEAQRKPRRGLVLGPEVAKALAASQSAEELAQRLQTQPEIAHRQARRQDGQAQRSRWDGGAAYLAAMNDLAAAAALPKRVEACRTALASVDRTQLPLVWAMVALDLADALRTQRANAQSAPMGEVITLYRAALEILSADGEPDQFAHAHRYLGDALLLDDSGDPRENIEAAIRSYETALGLQRAAVETVAWAAISAHLAEALLRRSHGDPSIDIDRAAALLEPVVDTLERRGDEPALLGAARLSLAAALTRGVSGSRDENLRRAARELRNAIDDVDPEAHPDLWTMANTHLGQVFLARASLDPAARETALAQAQACLRAAASQARGSAPVRARAHALLGWVLSDLARGAASDDEAVAHQESAIALLQGLGPQFDIERGHMHRNLALHYAERANKADDHTLERAEQHFRAALDVFPAEACPAERRDTLRPLGAMHFDAGRWADALASLEEAIDLSDVVLTTRFTELGKEEEAAANRNLYGMAAYCQIRLGRSGDALRTIERGKARMLAEALSWKDLDATELPAKNQRALRFAREAILRLEAEARGARATHDAQRSAQLGRQTSDAYRHLASLRPGGMSPAAPALGTLIGEIPAGTALLVPVVTTQGSAALLLPAGPGGGDTTHAILLDSLRVAGLAKLVSDWLTAYLAWVRAPASLARLQTGLDTLTATLWTELMGPVHERLRTWAGFEQAPVVVMPSGWLGLLPLHAASRTQDGSERTFGEDHPVSYTPSLRALHACHRRRAEKQRAGRRLMAVGNPTGDLHFAEIEVASISALFPADTSGGERVTRLEAAAATQAAVIRAVAGCQYLHFACHAEFHWSDAANSGLKLAGGDALRLTDILSPGIDLRASRLVTLSACETGMAEFRSMPDEFIGLPGAFLEAGAPAVISSLWPVADLSTSCLMTEFYRLHLSGLSAAEALQSAQQWLRTSTAKQLQLAKMCRRIYVGAGKRRSDALAQAQYYETNPDERPFAHPFYWAGFTVTGSLQ